MFETADNGSSGFLVGLSQTHGEENEVCTKVDPEGGILNLPPAITAPGFDEEVHLQSHKENGPKDPMLYYTLRAPKQRERSLVIHVKQILDSDINFDSDLDLSAPDGYFSTWINGRIILLILPNLVIGCFIPIAALRSVLRLRHIASQFIKSGSDLDGMVDKIHNVRNSMSLLIEEQSDSEVMERFKHDDKALDASMEAVERCIEVAKLAREWERRQILL